VDTRDWWDIQWTTSLGCTRVTEGCRFCSAASVAAYSPDLKDYARVEAGIPRWSGIVRPLATSLMQPERWRKPYRVFVSPSSDLFHDKLPIDFVDQVVSTIDRSRTHTFGVLTKRSGRMRDYFDTRRVPPNLRIGVSVESPSEISRVEDLLAISGAGVRWVSVEPMLAHVPLGAYLGHDQVNWVTAGPELGDEMGYAIRPCRLEWMLSLRDECVVESVPFFTKHLLYGQAYREQPDARLK